ncbi:TPA: agmatine deiminase family protein [Candidatus Woesearchaeota archaeon]|nr:agmatine deiminase family protein [Candidatus Woesearchaeota archaeon]
MNKQTPIKLGFRMPAEFEKQESIWLSWPHNSVTWPTQLKEVENIYVQFIKAIHTCQKVNLLVNDDKIQKLVTNKLTAAEITISQIIFHKIKTADTWIRDYGPSFVVNDKLKNTTKNVHPNISNQALAMVKWTFNAWGDKYDDLKEDNKVFLELNDSLKVHMFKADIVLEGGSIEVNGAGTLLTTEQCLLNKNRNPHLNKEEIEKYLKDYLNVKNILWLREGIVGDDTDGHIDDIARFVNKSTVVCCVEEDKDDDNYYLLKENYELLLKMKDQDGSKLNVVQLPMPGDVSVVDENGSQVRLPASYANFYIGNEAVVVPIFGHKNDNKALDIIQKLFPQRKVVGINCKALVYGLGTLHCCSQQEPAV